MQDILEEYMLFEIYILYNNVNKWKEKGKKHDTITKI